MKSKRKWRTRTKGTKRQKGLHFVVDGTSQQTKRLKLPKVNPRDINVNVTVSVAPTKEMRAKRIAVEKTKKVEERPIGILDPRTHPLQVHKIEDRIATPLRAPAREPLAEAEGVRQEVTITGKEYQPTAVQEATKLVEAGTEAFEKRAERAKARRTEKREEEQRAEEKAEQTKEKAKKEREEALERQEKWKKEQEEKKKAEEKKQLAKVKWAKRVEKKSYAEEALKVAKKEKSKKK